MYLKNNGLGNREPSPKVTMVVAAYNAEGTIKGCVEALLNTKYADKEIVAVNDGSTDATEKILRDFGGKITVLNKANAGVAQARNLALNKSDAEFIAFTDADCEVDPLWLEYAIRHFDDPKTGAVTGWLHYKITNTLSAIRETEYALRFKRRSSKAQSVSCPVAMLRREALRQINGFDPQFVVGGEDTEIGYRIIQQGYNVVYEKNMLAFHSPEEEILLYLKRNFRNGLNHFKILKKIRHKIFFNDDFFPFTLRSQPVFTAGLILSWCLLALTANLLWAAFIFICAAFILADFIPVALGVSRIKGILSVPLTFAVLALRNIAWLAALVAGIFYMLKP